METKVKHVRDAAYWGMPVGTPIEPGMKPVRTPRIRPKRVSSSSSGGKTPQTTGTIKPVADKPGDSKTPDVTPLDTSARSVADFSIESAAAELSKIAKDGRPDGAGTPEDPIDCGDDIDKAKKLLAEDKSIRLSTEREVSLLIDKIAEEARTAKEQGRDPFDYDLCKVTVPNTSLFCGESKGIPRAQMPQFSGQPEPGTYADAHMNKMKGEANVTEEFAQLLDTMDLNVTETSVPVNELKATQSQLVGAKVAGMRDAMREGKIKDAPIYVTRDGYIVDGHHRWAAKMALDLEDGKLGDVEMPVKMIDADIGYILDVSNGFARMAGIKPKGTGANAEGVKMIDVSEFYFSTINGILDLIVESKGQ